MGACAALIVYMIICATDNALDYYNILGQYVAVLAGTGLGLRAVRMRGKGFGNRSGSVGIQRRRDV